jgi:hypothetical protein
MFEFLFDNVFAFFTLVILAYSGLYYLISKLAFNENEPFFKIFLASLFGFVIGVLIIYLLPIRSCPSCEIEPTVWDDYLMHSIKYIPVITMILTSILISFFRKKSDITS